MLFSKQRKCESVGVRVYRDRHFCLQIFLHFELVNSGFPAFLHSQCFRGISKRPIQILSPSAYQSCVFCLKHIFCLCVMSEDFSVSNVFMCVCVKER